jgi:hypothetical protein
MKVLRWMFIFLLILGMAPARLAAQATLTNQDVVSLVKTGLSSDIIVAKIRASNCQFDTSAAGLKGLKDAGVPDAVIVVMVDPSSKSSAPADSASAGASSSSGDSAHVRVYRQKLLPGSNFNPPIYIDGKEVFKLANARRCSVRVSPGAHTVTSDDKTSMIQIDAKGGQEFFISVQELPGGFLKGRGKLTLVANEQGRPEYKLEKPLEEDKKTAVDMIEVDPDASAPEAK